MALRDTLLLEQFWAASAMTLNWLNLWGFVNGLVIFVPLVIRSWGPSMPLLVKVPGKQKLD